MKYKNDFFIMACALIALICILMTIVSCGRGDGANRNNVSTSDDVTDSACDNINITGDNNTVNCNNPPEPKPPCSAQVTVDPGASGFSVSNCVGTFGGTLEGVCPDGSPYLVDTFACGDMGIDVCGGSTNHVVKLIFDCGLHKTVKMES